MNLDRFFNFFVGVQGILLLREAHVAARLFPLARDSDVAAAGPVNLDRFLTFCRRVQGVLLLRNSHAAARLFSLARDSTLRRTLPSCTLTPPDRPRAYLRRLRRKSLPSLATAPALRAFCSVV